MMLETNSEPSWQKSPTSQALFFFSQNRYRHVCERVWEPTILPALLLNTNTNSLGNITAISTALISTGCFQS